MTAARCGRFSSRLRQRQDRNLDGLELVALHAEGGQGQLWKGRLPIAGGSARDVAVKVMKESTLEARATLLREAKLCSGLVHQNVVQVFGADEDGAGRARLAFEWVEGRDLASLLSETGPLPVGICVYITAHILRAVEQAHRAEILHRDISPDNVMVSRCGEVKLTDFGIGRLTSQETTGLKGSGKAKYAAPERLMGRPSMKRSDLWSVGSIFHEMLEGVAVRDSPADGEEFSLFEETFRSPRLKRAVPPHLVELHRRLTCWNLANRFENAREALDQVGQFLDVADALGRLVRGEGELALRDEPGVALLPARTTPPSATARPAWRRALPSFAFALSAAIAGASGYLVALSSTGPSAASPTTGLSKLADSLPKREHESETAEVDPVQVSSRPPHVGAGETEVAAAPPKTGTNKRRRRPPQKGDEVLPSLAAEDLPQPEPKLVRVLVISPMPRFYAWARFDGGPEIAIRRNVPKHFSPGKHRVTWRKAPEEKWRSTEFSISPNTKKLRLHEEKVEVE